MRGSRSKFPRRWMHCQCELRPVFLQGVIENLFSPLLFQHLLYWSQHIHISLVPRSSRARVSAPRASIFGEPFSFLFSVPVSLSCGLCCLCLCVLFSYRVVFGLCPFRVCFCVGARCGTVCQVYTAKDLIRRHVDASGQRFWDPPLGDVRDLVAPCAHRGSRSKSARGGGDCLGAHTPCRT